MGAAVILTSRSLAVEPGGETSTALTVRNDGDVVDELRLDVLGPAVGWVTVEPAAVRLFPGGEQAVTVRAAPPRTPAVRAGTVPFAVRAVPREDPLASAVDEGTVAVGPFVEVAGELMPRTSRGRLRAAAEVAVANRGNVAVDLDVVPVDPDAQLRVAVRPSPVHVEPGAVVFARLRLRPGRLVAGGPSRTLPYRVLIEPRPGGPGAGTGPGGSTVVEGTVVQEPVVPRGLGRVAALGLAAAAVAGGAWVTVLRPAVRSAAREATAQLMAPVMGMTADEAGRAMAAMEGPVPPPAPADPPAPGAGGDDPATTVPPSTTTAPPATRTPPTTMPVARTAGTPQLIRVQVETAGRAARRQTFPGRSFALTDLVFQNPAGDRGRIIVSRGDDVVLELALDSFRQLDFHYVTPVVLDGQDLVVTVDCAAPGAGPDGDPGPRCRDAVSAQGYVTPLPRR